LLEGFAIADSGKQFSVASRQELRQLCELMETSAADGDDEALVDVGARFHRLLYGRTANQQLLENIERLSNKLHLLFYRHWANFYSPDQIRDRHHQLLELVFEGDEWAVEQGFRQHYIETGHKVAALYTTE
jgi:DNA-binding GntR family transcriptional regulator